MSLSANYISELVQSAPDGAVQKVSVLDDHLRMLKRVLQTQFPNFGTTAVTPTAAELNQLAGAGAVQFKSERGAVNGYASLGSDGKVPVAQLPFGDSSFPSGTRLLFQQTTPPAGWNKITTNVNNRALRLTSGSVSSGGSMPFTTAFAANRKTGNEDGAGVFVQQAFVVIVPESDHQHSIDMDVQYIDVVLGEKV